jgi:Putative Ig domain
LAAPGANIYSTKRLTNYGFISGTSMSAGEVSGAAALILSQGYQSVSNLKSMILNNVDPLPSLTGLVRTGGRLNVCNAVPGCATAITATPTNIEAPLVVSTAQFGHGVGAWTGKWGGSPTSFSYQWSRCDGNGANCTPIAGATSSTYMVLANADVGSTLEVSVSASNANGTASVTSAASPTVQAAGASSWSVSSTILDGTTISGQVFWQATSSLASANVNNIQFFIDGNLKSTEFSSPYNYNGTGTLDTTKLTQGTHVLALRGVANDLDLSNAYNSAAVIVCNPPKNTGLPVISGAAKQGKTLTIGNGSWTLNPVSFAYQWNRCDSSGANCAAIAGATANSYVLIDADVGSTIRSAVTATNQCGASSTATSKATAVVQGSAPTVITTSLPSGTLNVPYSTTLAASGGIQPYTWSIVAGTGNLPSGLSLNSSTGVISGTPTATGTRSFTARVTDANSMTATQTLSITITAGVSIATTTLPEGEQNVAYSTTLAASGGTQPYTWSITTGTLPSGLSLNSGTGVISGTPTVSGTSNFTVQVTDTNSQSGTKGLSITIAAPPSISTTTLPGGTQNTAYSTTLAASGGTQPYTWSITLGTLPSGLSLNSSTGVISGTPTATGTSNFTAQVTDANSQSASKSLSITIAPGGGGGGIGLVQSAAVQGTSVISLTQAFPGNNTAGNLIVVFVRASTTSQTVTVTDTAGNTYALAVMQTQTSDGHQVRIFYAKSATSGPNTVTATFSATNNHPWLAVFEYTGVSALDQTAHAQGTGSTPNTGLTATTASNSELVFAGLGVPNANTATVTAGTGLQLLLQDAPPNTSRAATEGQITAVSGQYAGTFTLSAGTNWSAVVATFK